MKLHSSFALILHALISLAFAELTPDELAATTADDACQGDASNGCSLDLLQLHGVSADTLGKDICATTWVQCGGKGYTGPTCCTAGDTCNKNNEYYSQCVPEKTEVHAAPSMHDPIADKCYNVFANMEFNNLIQDFPSNPDSHGKGYVNCKLCTGGDMTCNANVYGGKTMLIASHIHVATNGNGDTGSGPPVINFCGSNEMGMILDGTAYPEGCMPYKAGDALEGHMKGVFVEGAPNAGFTLAQRVQDIGEHPGKYYFNFHSIASWTHWQIENKGPVGMCRGQLQSS